MIGRTSFPWFEAVLVVYPAGVGKTEAATRAINTLLPDGTNGQVLIVAETHGLLSEIEKKLTVPAVHVYGRNETTCGYPLVAKAMRGKYLDMGELVCKNVCPLKDECVYYGQFVQPVHVWLVTAQMARSLRFRYVWDEESGRQALRPWALVVYDDVSAFDAFVDEVEVSSADLLRAAGVEELGEIRPLLEALAGVVASATHTASGVDLWNRIEDRLGGFDAVGRWVTYLDATNPGEAKSTLPGGRMPTVGEVDEQIPAFVGPLVDALRTEGAAFLSGQAFNARLSAKSDKLTIRWREEPEYVWNSPVMVLNATPDMVAWKDIIGRPVSVVGTEPVALAKGVEIVQFADYFSGKGALRGPKHLTSRLRLIDDLLTQLPRPVVLVSFLEHEDLAREYFGERGVTVVHFWALRGLNEFEDFSSMIVLGCPTPNMGEVILRLAAFYGNSSPLDTRMAMTEDTYWTPQGVHQWAVDVHHYLDPRVDAALQSLREDELLQVVFRLRPLSRSTPCRIVILTEQPIAGLPVHLTGIGGVYCPSLDWSTGQVINAAPDAIAQAYMAGRDCDETGDVAQLAFGDRSRESRAMVIKGGRLDEVVYHTGLIVEQVQMARSLSNGGRSSYSVWTFRSGP